MPQDADEAERQLGSLMDDMYVFEGNQEARWKWRNGDLVLADWHKNRGNALPWDTIVVVQWDMLVLGPVDQVFGMLRPDEVLLSGLRPVAEVKAWWPWVRQPELQREFNEFLEYMRSQYGFADAPLCCLFIVACLSRRFMDLYSGIRAADRRVHRVQGSHDGQGSWYSVLRGPPLSPLVGGTPLGPLGAYKQAVLKAVGEDVPERVIVRRGGRESKGLPSLSGSVSLSPLSRWR